MDNSISRLHQPGGEQSIARYRSAGSSLNLANGSIAGPRSSTALGTGPSSESSTDGLFEQLLQLPFRSEKQPSARRDDNEPPTRKRQQDKVEPKSSDASKLRTDNDNDNDNEAREDEAKTTVEDAAAIHTLLVVDTTANLTAQTDESQTNDSGLFEIVVSPEQVDEGSDTLTTELTVNATQVEGTEQETATSDAETLAQASANSAASGPAEPDVQTSESATPVDSAADEFAAPPIATDKSTSKDVQRDATQSVAQQQALSPSEQDTSAELPDKDGDSQLSDQPERTSQTITETQNADEQEADKGEKWYQQDSQSPPTSSLTSSRSPAAGAAPPPSGFAFNSSAGDSSPEWASENPLDNSSSTSAPFSTPPVEPTTNTSTAIVTPDLSPTVAATTTAPTTTGGTTSEGGGNNAAANNRSALPAGLATAPSSGQRETSASGAQAGNTPDAAENSQQERVRLVQRVARSFSRLGTDGGQVHLRLHPPQLGSLAVRVQMEGNTMSARLSAESQAAREIIIEGLPVLRKRLADQAIEISQFHVDVSDPNDNSPLGGNPQEHNHSARQDLMQNKQRYYALFRRDANRNIVQLDNAPIQPQGWITSNSIDVHA